MNQIINVQNNNGELLVSSREVAKNFNKEHKHILEKIDRKRKELNKSVEKSTDVNNLKIFFLDNFLEDFYLDENNREQRQVLLTRDAFSFITMGFSGIKSDCWKIKYIEAFNKMEHELKEIKYKRILQVEERIEKLENTMTIDYEQAQILLNVKNSVCVAILGGKDSKAYKHKAKKLYSALWRDYKDYFSVNSYKNTPRKEFDKAKSFLSNWTPNGKLLREIELMNSSIE